MELPLNSLKELDDFAHEKKEKKKKKAGRTIDWQEVGNVFFYHFTLTFVI